MKKEKYSGFKTFLQFVLMAVMVFLVAVVFLPAQEVEELDEKNQFRLFSFLETDSLRMQFVIPNAAKNFQPLLYLGPKLVQTKKFTLTLMGANTFKGTENDFKLAVNAAFISGNWFLSSQFDYSFTPQNIWNITQVKYTTGNVVIGMELDNKVFGTNEKRYTSFGPCVGLKLKDYVSVNFTYFFRWDYTGEYKPVFRFYLILNLNNF